jgi:hypothetical protein
MNSISEKTSNLNKRGTNLDFKPDKNNSSALYSLNNQSEESNLAGGRNINNNYQCK